MKRFVSVLVLLCLACMVGSAFAEDSGRGCIGFWTAIRVTVNGMEMDPASGGAMPSLILSETGEADLLAVKNGAESSSVSGFWEPAEGGIFFFEPDRPPVFCPLEDGILVVDRGGGIVMYFALAFSSPMD